MVLKYIKKIVKIYHNPDNKKIEAKLKEMILFSQTESFQQSGLGQVMAWPLALIFNEEKEVIGYAMNKIMSAFMLDDLYMYPPKQENFIMEDKVDCAISLCNSVSRIHQLGQVFGDGNPQNIKIDITDSSVHFLDVDSFHFTALDEKLYKCEVCAPGYIAPELVKKCKETTYGEYAGETFNKMTDRFSLAVHIFRLLFNGAHPYNCQEILSENSACISTIKSVECRVEHGDTPFFRNIPGIQWPGSP